MKHISLILIIIAATIAIAIALYLIKQKRTISIQHRVVQHGTVSLYTESFGDRHNAAVVLISGAGAPARFWTDHVCMTIAQAGYFVIRFDHRDQGLSSAVDFEKHPYTVLDIADDVIAILDAYHLKKAHIVGHSMGGLVAQLLAIHHPERVMSMTSMSVGTAGNIGAPPQEIMDVLLENKPTQHFKESLPGFMKSWRILNGDYPLDEAMAIAYTKDMYERSHHPVGVAWNHIKAQEGFGDLSDQLKTISVPSFFIHGQKDPLIPIAAGIATSKQVPQAHMQTIPGMGHMMFNTKLENTIITILLNSFKQQKK